MSFTMLAMPMLRAAAIIVRHASAMLPLHAVAADLRHKALLLSILRHCLFFDAMPCLMLCYLPLPRHAAILRFYAIMMFTSPLHAILF